MCSTLLAQWVLLAARDGRYLLPFSWPLVMLAGVELTDLVHRRVVPRRVAVAATAAMMLLGSLSMVEFKDFWFMWKNDRNSMSEAKRLELLIDYMKAKGVKHVYSLHGALQW